MTIEVFLLALANTVRPTSLAAVYALVASKAPRRMMTAYVSAGLTFTVLFGLLVVSTLHGIAVHSGTEATRGVAEIVGGVIALGFAVLVATRPLGAPRHGDAPRPPGRWGHARSRRLTMRTAALAGPATHIPGLFYLLALNVIVTDRPRVTVAFVEVAIYNLVWFALPLAALGVCIARPALAKRSIGILERWARTNARAILLAGSLAVALLLIVRGALLL